LNRHQILIDLDRNIMNLYAQTVPTISEYYTQGYSEIHYHDIELSHVVLHDPAPLRGPGRDLLSSSHCCLAEYNEIVSETSNFLPMPLV
jgi:hypothetical protein